MQLSNIKSFSIILFVFTSIKSILSIPNPHHRGFVPSGMYSMDDYYNLGKRDYANYNYFFSNYNSPKVLKRVPNQMSQHGAEVNDKFAEFGPSRTFSRQGSGPVLDPEWVKQMMGGGFTGELSA